MVTDFANKKIIFSFYCLLFTCFTNASIAVQTGTVVYDDLSPAPGTVVYALDVRRPLEVTNNTIMTAEYLRRAITDSRGAFALDKVPSGNAFFFVRDMEDNCGLASVFVEGNNLGQIVIHKAAVVKGNLLRGNKPVTGETVTAIYLEGGPYLRYLQTAVTDGDGAFAFEGLMPGKYVFEVIKEVPQVGCCFNSVITKQLHVRLFPGEQKRIKLGGTNLPFLHGKITDATGKGLHGVWVRVEPKGQSRQPGPSSTEPSVVWSSVTERDGSYEIFDIPPGKYTLRCFRRLALNDYTRTLQAAKDVVINGSGRQGNNPSARVENICDFSINLEPFMPLRYGQAAPPVAGTLIDGRKFNLSEHRGKVVVLYFYTTWCSICVTNGPQMEALTKKFNKDKVLVLGVSLDNNIGDCRKYVLEKKIHYPQLFAGPWTDSDLRKAYRVINVPTTFIIDPEGKIAQINLFGPTLENFIDELLKGN